MWRAPSDLLATAVPYTGCMQIFDMEVTNPIIKLNLAYNTVFQALVQNFTGNLEFSSYGMQL